MKSKKIIIFLSAFLIVGNGLGFVSNASEKHELSNNSLDAVTGATIIKWYKTNDIPNEFWIDDHREKVMYT